MGVRNKRRQLDLQRKRQAKEYRQTVQKDYRYNYLITLMYDGYEFGGYAKQKHQNTIQNILESVLETVLKEHVKTIESSRTDAKVHALDQKVMFKYYQKLDLRKFVESLNNMLPKAIRVVDVTEISEEFHCRYDVVSKTYKYYIARTYNPFKRFYEYYHYKKLDVKAMQKACKHIVGTHDFSAFCSAKATQEDKTRTVLSLDLVEDGDLIILTIKGKGFLYNMVRIIVGTLLEVGEGRIAPHDLKEIISSLDRKKAGQTAPAHGLYLTEIKY